MPPGNMPRLILPIPDKVVRYGPASNPRIDHALRAAVRQMFGVEIPDVPCGRPQCTSTPWRAFHDAYYCKSPVSVWKASRGFGGKSFLLSLLGLMQGLTIKADVNLLGGSGEQSQRVLEHMDRFWAKPNAPRHMLAKNTTRTEATLQWGNTINALTASQKSVRGPHPQKLLLDEIDEMDLDILDAALGQPMSLNGIPQQTVMSSTAQYTDGPMAEMRKRATENGWPWHEWCYRENLEPHGWLSQSDVAVKRAMVSRAMWENEYENQEPNPESRAINTDAVRQMFRRDLGEYRGAPNEYIETEPPQPGASYVTGADWARKQDWTVIVTLRLDVNPYRIVAFERTGREPWPVMIEKFNARCNRYQGNAAHDGTGVGDVVNDHLTSWAESVLMVGRTRSDMLTHYIAAVERGEIESPFIEWMEGEHRLAGRDDVYRSTDEAGRHHLPDSICAASLAYRAACGGLKFV